MERKEKSLPKKLFNDKKIERLLSPKTKMDLKIEKVLMKLETNYNLLLVSDEANYFYMATAVLKKLSKKSSCIVYVTVNKPFEKIKRLLKDEGIEPKNLKFVDMVTLQVGGKKTRDKTVSYLPSASSLTELIQEIERQIKEKSGQKILLFDSISTLLVYNEFASVEKMVHSLMGKLDLFNVAGIFLMVKSQEHKGIIQTISQFCDKVIEI